MCAKICAETTARGWDGVGVALAETVARASRRGRRAVRGGDGGGRTEIRPWEVSTLSPEGRLFQVEYASEAIKLSEALRTRMVVCFGATSSGGLLC
uniref:Proteasome alpha-type subunits domain-containing protein n=1 Tax=Leersia perrieri TaxID=77586 RepID=A0A0D9XU23_9ORYZ